MTQIFGVPIDNLSRKEILERVNSWLKTDEFHRIATVNPEFLLLAEKNSNFKQSLLAADLRIADGIGLHFPFWLSGEKLIGHYPGVDLMHDILRMAEEMNKQVALALHEHGLSTPVQILACLKERYPKLRCRLYSEVLTLDTRDEILFCNYGAPLQETYLESFRTKKGNIKLVMGVGGAFDYLTGVLPRAPKICRQLGLEWLWRLYQQPRRFRRIWNAVGVFPIKVLSQK